MTSTYSLNFEGIVSFINSQTAETAPAGIMKWVSSFMNKMPCPECNGSRLKKESLQFRIDGRNIALFDLAIYSISGNTEKQYRFTYCDIRTVNRNLCG